MTRAVALSLTIFTGFTGLVYQVTWQKYLATLLGSHSEATAAVLGIFLGGLSLGYWLFGLVTQRQVERVAPSGAPTRLLLTYGAIEAAIGIYALLFPMLFRAAHAFSSVLPHGHAGLGFLFDVLLSALLIAPPAVMMGATIPILTQALSRSLSDATRFHAFVYGLNTIGAFAGALAAGFYLIPRLGLDGSLVAMGFVNLLAGACYAALHRISREPGLPGDLEGQSHTIGEARPYLLAALLIGFAMMTLETTLIRLAGLSFGSSQFTFSMVVAAFVLCIAIGALVVSAFSRIARAVLLIDLWGLVLLLMGLYFLLPQAPYWVYVLRTAFSEYDAAFYAYYVAGFLLLLFVIGLPVLLSGAALPLIFHHLRTEFGALGSLAGRLYCWNTVGSLIGALLGGYAMFFWFDLHEIYRFVVAAVVGSASLLTASAGKRKTLAVAMATTTLAILIFFPPWSPNILQSGLFRESKHPPDIYDGYRNYVERYIAPYDRNVLSYEDDPATSVAVRSYIEADGRESRSIIVNGKSDSNTTRDIVTLNLLSTLPALLADRVERAFVVGWGTGVTVGELARINGVKEIVVAEISSGVIKADAFFEGFNRSAMKQPNVNVIRSDAYRALSRTEQRFDLIISEPSNPWVTGVEMLYSQEFLTLARERLDDGGVFAQWFHTYETDNASLQLVLRTFDRVFEHTSVWQATSLDLIILGFRNIGPAVDYHRLVERSHSPKFQPSLVRAGIGSPGELLAKELLPIGTWRAAGFEGPIHTLYRPLLNDAAGRAFFRRDTAMLPFTGHGEAARVGARNALLRRHFDFQGERLGDDERAAIVEQSCLQSGGYCITLVADWMRENPESEAFDRARASARAWFERHRPEDDAVSVLEDLAGLFDQTSPITASTTPETAWELTELYADFYYHAVPFDPAALDRAWSNCRERSKTREQCGSEVPPDSAKAIGLLREEDRAIEDYIERCMEQRFEGPKCREGALEARKVLAGDTTKVRRLSTSARN